MARSGCCAGHSFQARDRGQYIAQKTKSGWVVDFGRLNMRGDKFLVAHEAIQSGSTTRFSVRNFDPAHEETGWDLTAARGIEAAMKDFHGADRPYNVAVLPAEHKNMYVYLHPAQVEKGVYLLGADVRYCISPDGAKILEKRQMHGSIIKYGPVGSSEKTAAGYHTHVLSDVPEDSDVLMVLTRQPRVCRRSWSLSTTCTPSGSTARSRLPPDPNKVGAALQQCSEPAV